MSTEIYIRDEKDPNYTKGILEHNDPLEFAIQRLKTILMTKRGDVIGFPTFGCSIEDLLFEFNLNNKQLEERIRLQVLEFANDILALDFKVEVKFFKGDFKDICLIDIYLNGLKVLGYLV